MDVLVLGTACTLLLASSIHRKTLAVSSMSTSRWCCTYGGVGSLGGLCVSDAAGRSRGGVVTYGWWSISRPYI